MFTMFTVITMIIMFPLFIMFQVKQRHLGKGTMLTASFRRSALSWPGNLRQVSVEQLIRFQESLYVLI